MQYVHTVLFLSHTVCRSHASGTFIKHVLHIFLQIVIYSKLISVILEDFYNHFISKQF